MPSCHSQELWPILKRNDKGVLEWAKMRWRLPGPQKHRRRCSHRHPQHQEPLGTVRFATSIARRAEFARLTADFVGMGFVELPLKFEVAVQGGL
jgi:hypothetical protein